ncbi:hypothetical protein ABVT39_018124 [Epinephelus coioides]
MKDAVLGVAEEGSDESTPLKKQGLGGYVFLGRKGGFSPNSADAEEWQGCTVFLRCSVQCYKQKEKVSFIVQRVKKQRGGRSSLPKLRDPEPLLEHLQDLGVEDLQDLSYLQESDLLSVLRPTEVRKLLSLLKKTSQQDVLDSPPSNQSNEQFSTASTSASPVTQSDEMPLSAKSSCLVEPEDLRLPAVVAVFLLAYCSWLVS